MGAVKKPSELLKSMARPSLRATPGSVNPGIEQMQKALVDAGWTRKHANVWQTPDGRYYRGPALAYHIMMGLPWPPQNASQEPPPIGDSREQKTL